MQDSAFERVLELGRSRKPAYMVDHEYRGSEPARITGFGYHDFRGTSQGCFETVFDNGEERLVPMDYITDQIVEVAKGEREFVNCYIIATREERRA